MIRLSDTEVLVEVERLVEEFRERGARADTDHPRHRAYLALKSCARDLRSRVHLRSEEAIRNVDDAMETLRSARSALEVVAGSWPVLRMSLARRGK